MGLGSLINNDLCNGAMHNHKLHDDRISNQLTVVRAETQLWQVVARTRLTHKYCGFLYFRLFEIRFGIYIYSVLYAHNASSGGVR